MSATAFKNTYIDYVCISLEQQQAAPQSVENTIQGTDNKLESELENLWKSTSDAVEPLWVDT
jgi:hypothetical protein